MALSAEELPADFFGPDAASPSAAPPGAATTEAATVGGTPRVPAGGAPRRAADLRTALLGPGASADQQPEAVRDTVTAIEELFPGTLMSALPRADGGRDEVGGGEDGEAAGPEVVGADGSAPADEAPTDDEIADGDGGGTRLDFGPSAPKRSDA